MSDARVQIALAALSVSQFVMIATTSDLAGSYLHDQGHSVRIIGIGVVRRTCAGCTWPRRCRGGFARRFGRLLMIGAGRARPHRRGDGRGIAPARIPSS